MFSRTQILKSLVVAAPLAAVSGVSAYAGGAVEPVVAPIPAPVVEPAPVVGNWQGAYVGATLGYAFGGSDRVGIADGPNGSVQNLDKLKLKGANGGLRAGYRWQNNNWVFGPELSIEGGNIKDSFKNYEGYDASSKIKNMIALRGKVGYAVQPDMLVYGMAGVARAKIDTELKGTGATGTANIDDSYSKTGYVVGLGVEKMLTDRLSLTGEYEYANFGKETVKDAAGMRTESTPKYSNVKVGLNFKF